jgi:hypothetical protein
MAQENFSERAEQVLIGGMVLGIGLIMQRVNVDLYRAGLVILSVSTLLQIAVGNIPKQGSVSSSLIRIALILVLIAVIFAAGVLLVPTLSRMGR